MQAGGNGGPHPSQTSQTSGGPRRQSGVPAPSSLAQSPYDPAAFGLPDLTRNAPHMTPRIPAASAPEQPPSASQPPRSTPGASQPGQPHTLGVTSKLARLRATGSPSMPPYAGTLTQQMRAIEPPDVARQTLDEQKMLAGELLTLPDAIETSGLAKTHERAYFETVRAYADLADATWLAVAEERLEQTGAEEVYRQSAIAIARRITRMRNESQLAANNTQFPLPRKRPLFWRRRVRLHRDGLRAWQARLNAPADARAMGAALAYLRGTTALAEASNFELLLWSLLPSVAGDAVMILWLGLVLALIAVIAQGMVAPVGALALAASVTLGVRLLLELLLRKGPARLDHQFALSVFSSLRSPRAANPGSRIIAVLLRGWGILLGTAGLIGIPVALGYSIWQLLQKPITLPTLPLGWLGLSGNLIARAMLLPTEVAAAAVGALALPVLLLSALRYIGELGGNIGWVAAGRRYALAPALQVLAFLAAGTVAALVALAPIRPLTNMTLVRLHAGSLPEVVTLQTAALFLAPALVLLIGLDIPYRVGIFRWRRYWLAELATRRAEIDAHVRRLSALDPQTGTQDTSNENLRAMQYDMVLLQFYTTRTDETRRVSSAPYGLFTFIGVILLLAAVALLTDGLAQQIAHLLLNVG